MIRYAKPTMITLCDDIGTPIDLTNHRVTVSKLEVVEPGQLWIQFKIEEDWQILQYGAGPRYRLRVPANLPERFIPTKTRLVEQAPDEAGGDLWELLEWKPVREP